MRLRSVLLTACSAVALTSCGGEEQERRAVGPSIPADVAERLAGRSDRVAEHLEAGDPCAARSEAAALRSDLTTSVDRIPPLYLEDLSGLVNEIEAQIPACETAAPPGETTGEEGKEPPKDRGKGKGKDKKKGKGGSKDDDRYEQKEDD